MDDGGGRLICVVQSSSVVSDPDNSLGVLIQRGDPDIHQAFVLEASKTLKWSPSNCAMPVYVAAQMKD